MIRRNTLWATHNVLMPCWFLLAAGGFFVSTESISAPLMISSHPSYPPIMFQQDNELLGVAVDVAVEILEHLKVPYELVSTGQWNRVQQSAKAGKIDMIAGLYRNSEREDYLDFTAPIMDDPVVLFIKKGKAFPFNKAEDLIGRSGVTNLGESFGTEIDYFIETKLQVQRVVKYEVNLRLLEHDRADYFIFGLYPGRAQIKKLGYADKIEALKTPIVVEKIYLAFSKQSPYRDLIPKFNDYIQSHVNPEKLEALVLKNIMRFERN